MMVDLYVVLRHSVGVYGGDLRQTSSLSSANTWSRKNFAANISQLRSYSYTNGDKYLATQQSKHLHTKSSQKKDNIKINSPKYQEQLRTKKTNKDFPPSGSWLEEKSGVAGVITAHVVMKTPAGKVSWTIV